MFDESPPPFYNSHAKKDTFAQDLENTIDIQLARGSRRFHRRGAQSRALARHPALRQHHTNSGSSRPSPDQQNLRDSRLLSGLCGRFTSASVQPYLGVLAWAAESQSARWKEGATANGYCRYWNPLIRSQDS